METKIQVVDTGSPPYLEVSDAVARAARQYMMEVEYLGHRTVPEEDFEKTRMQVRADALLKHLAKTHRLAEGSQGLVLTEWDIFARNYNFVFGLAEPGIGWAVVSTFRLHSLSKEVYLARLEKEVAHELGHLSGLGHCTTSRCVMSFSNSVADVDAKGPSLCRTCSAKASTRLSHQ